jgi:membrane-anchored protein YejM (alkaline phosphatase superfamily)
MSARRRLLRWGSWFAVANAAVLGVVGVRYLWYYSALGLSPAWVYAILAYVGQMSALAYLPFLLLLVPAIVLLPRPHVILPLAVVLASIALGVLLLDSLVFAENRYHLSPLRFALLAPQTWAFLALYVLLGIAIEAMLAGWLWRRTAHPPVRQVGRCLAAGLAICFVSSHLIHAWADAHYYVPVTAFTRYLPLYFPLKDSRRMARLGLVDEARAREHRLVSSFGRPSGGDLTYPLAPLRCQPPSPPLNVLLVVIDGMRADTLTPAVAPRLAGFAPETIRFDAHYSGGNASRAGMFSIFYSLPATYWDAFADVARPPVLMDLFREYGYQLGLFSSSPLNSWVVELDRTALARIPNLRLGTDSPSPGSSSRDRILTDEWYAWLDHRDATRPFFGFLFYNAAVAFEPPEHYEPVVPVRPGGTEWERRHVRYLNAVHYIDALIGNALDDLKRRRLLERTVVIVTSDHGMEFDENGLGFTGHGTAYSELQLHSPLLVRWPGRPPGRVTRRTSHYDLVPTLLTGVFGCTNPPSDYASGQSLFAGSQWDWLIAASHNDFALIEPDRVTIAYPADYEIRDRDYHLVQNPRIPHDGLRAALREMRRFYR